MVDQRYSRAHEWIFDGSARAQAITRITLRPHITFSGQRSPSATERREIHEEAHRRCFIANSLRSEIVIEEP